MAATYNNNNNEYISIKEQMMVAYEAIKTSGFLILGGQDEESFAEAIDTRFLYKGIIGVKEMHDSLMKIKEVIINQ